MQTNISKIYKDKSILITAIEGYFDSLLRQTLSWIDCNLRVLNCSSSSWNLSGFFKVKINNY